MPGAVVENTFAPSDNATSLSPDVQTRFIVFSLLTSLAPNITLNVTQSVPSAAIACLSAKTLRTPSGTVSHSFGLLPSVPQEASAATSEARTIKYLANDLILY